MAELTAIPGIGRGRAGDIVVDRPHQAMPDVEELGRFATLRSPEGAD
jgi:DNA uptake protein ComE-like DNA-binding protein